MSELDELVYIVLRLFDSLGAIAAGVLLLRRTKRRAVTGELNDQDVDLRFGLAIFLIGSGLLFGRSLLLGTPGGFHLALISIPLIWILRPLVRGELQHRKDRR